MPNKWASALESSKLRPLRKCINCHSEEAKRPKNLKTRFFTPLRSVQNDTLKDFRRSLKFQVPGSKSKEFQVQSSKFKVKTQKPQNFSLVTGKPRILNNWVLGIFLLLVFGIFTTPALAHRVLVFAYAAGDTIHTEGKFVPNTPVRQGQVQVSDQKTGQVLVTGKTDNQGKFSFKIPAPAAAQKMDLKVVVAAAMGHQGEWLLKAASYLPGAKTATAASASGAPAPASTPTAAAPGAKATGVDPQMLEETMNKALERQLGPIKEKLAEMAGHRTALTDIIGGLGYILGFFGLWAYFQSKRKQNS